MCGAQLTLQCTPPALSITYTPRTTPELPSSHCLLLMSDLFASLGCDHHVNTPAWLGTAKEPRPCRWLLAEPVLLGPPLGCERNARPVGEVGREDASRAETAAASSSSRCSNKQQKQHQHRCCQQPSIDRTGRFGLEYMSLCTIVFFVKPVARQRMSTGC
jgi:hypothetical protein